MTCTRLDWDSRFFGLRIARIDGARLDEPGLRAVERWCDNAAIDCLYFLADFDPETIAVVERAGFGLKDVRMTFRRALAAAEGPSSSSGFVVRPALPEDVAPLEALAERSHRDSRFYADTRFSRAQCDALYRSWLRNSVDGWADDVLVLARANDGTPLGYVTGHRRDGGSHIGLIAVAEDARGAGGATLLVDTLCARYAALDIATMTVVTQARNLGAQRLYQRLGFVSSATGLWYHRWWMR